jgi:hypothetical protein
MTITKMQGRPREERKAFIVDMLDRFLPKVPDPFIRKLTVLPGPREREGESKP